MRTDLLIKLRDLLIHDAYNPEGIRFDMGSWGKGYDEEWDFAQEKVEANCGTKGCAFGLAAMSGIFEDEGLGYYVKDSFLTPTYSKNGRVTENHIAAIKLFEITPMQGLTLFDPAAYPSNRTGKLAELEVVRRINELLETSDVKLPIECTERSDDDNDIDGDPYPTTEDSFNDMIAGWKKQGWID